MTKTTSVLVLLASARLLGGGDYTALDRYVAAPDASYHYQLVRTFPLAGGTVYQLEVVSQTWLSTAEVNRPEWRHWVTIAQPSRVGSSTAILFINGGSNTTAPDTPDPLVTGIAAQIGAVVIEVGQVPNQPLQFAGDSAARSEDRIISYTWDKYLRTGDERWPATLPMTKAAVRAMDAATDFLAKLPSGGVTVKNFIVTGASKRGWTTWTTAAVDARVIAIAPMVIDVLNMQASLEHQWRAYGFYSPALEDYVDLGVMTWFGTAQMASLLEIVDPYQYRERLALPKYLIDSAGDQFFPPDSAQFYFRDLPGEKYLRYVPNTDHSLAGLDAPANLLAWAQAVLQNYPRPRFHWRAEREHSLVVRAVDRPSKVLLWQATNLNARDFRLEKIGAAWTSRAVEGENGVYSVSVAAPPKGWTAFFVELTFPGVGELPLVFTTEVTVTPGVYPFEGPGEPTPRPRLAR